jgi:D-tyrosyl-tRNA(Tyr) deacylase
MRAVAQRVSSASVRVGDEVVASMGAGLLGLVGGGLEDGPADAEELARKLVHLRIFADEDGRMNRSLLDVGGALGVVSQFTLQGDARQGRRPSFVAAAPAERARPLVEAVAEVARELGVEVVTGRFQAEMQVTLVGEGPVTILLDTQKGF